MRIEKDSLGEVYVEDGALWKAQTQRSLNNFKIGDQKIPYLFIKSHIHLKKACAKANSKLNNLDSAKRDIIVKACDKLLEDDFRFAFPLSVWQTGSGTQTNMNVNEVITTVANQIDENISIHPNDDVNKSQSTNDTFPTSMHISSIICASKLKDSLNNMIEEFKRLTSEYKDVVKIGRTHLQDAVPLRLSDSFKAFQTTLEKENILLEQISTLLCEIPIGGSAVGSGLNVKKGFDQLVCDYLNEDINLNLSPMKDKFYGLQSKNLFSQLHNVFANIASDLLKIANDIRFLSSGPRCGLGELEIPANEPGSSIMPGKVNPTQCEAMIQVCAQVMGANVGVNIANSMGNFELNVMMPMIIYNIVNSSNLLSDALDSFTDHLLKGLKANRKKINSFLNNSLMLVTALSPEIGYDNASKLAKYAHENNLSLKEANSKLQMIDEKTFEELTDPEKMV